MDMTRHDSGHGVAVIGQDVCAPCHMQVRAQQDEAPAAALMGELISRSDDRPVR